MHWSRNIPPKNVEIIVFIRSEFGNLMQMNLEYHPYQSYDDWHYELVSEGISETVVYGDETEEDLLKLAAKVREQFQDFNLAECDTEYFWDEIEGFRPFKEHRIHTFGELVAWDNAHPLDGE